MICMARARVSPPLLSPSGCAGLSMGAPLSTGDQAILKRRISARWCTLSTLGKGAARVATMRLRTAAGKLRSAARTSIGEQSRVPSRRSSCRRKGEDVIVPGLSRRRYGLALELDAVVLVIAFLVGPEDAQVFLVAGIGLLSLHAPQQGGIGQWRAGSAENVVPHTFFGVIAARNDGELAGGWIKIQAQGVCIHVLQIQAVVALLGKVVVATGRLRLAFPFTGEQYQQVSVIKLLDRDTPFGITPGAGRHGGRRGQVVIAHQIRRGSLCEGIHAKTENGFRCGAFRQKKWSHYCC